MINVDSILGFGVLLVCELHNGDWTADSSDFELASQAKRNDSASQIRTEFDTFGLTVAAKVPELLE